MENLPDLPQLESVKANGVQSHFDSRVYSNKFIGYTIIILGTAEHITRMALDFIESINTSHAITKFNLILASLVMFMLIIENCFLKVHKWHTDTCGLTAHKLFWKNYIRWSDIREIKVRESSLTKMPAGYKFITRHGCMWIPIPTLTTSNRQYSMLLGSIWQHLRRFGKENYIEFPEEIEDLWWKIPDSIPQEISWSNPYPPDWRPLRGLLIVKAAGLLLIACLATFYLGWHIASAPVIIFTLALGGISCFLAHFLHKDRTFAVSAVVNTNGIDADTGYGRKSISWNDIKSANWDGSEVALKISGRGITIRIPNHGNASMFLLAILRNLRAIEKFENIEIPKEMRNQIEVIA